MTDFTICNSCDYPGSFETSEDVQLVKSNVRKFSHEKFTVWRCLSCGSLHSKEKVDLDYYYSDYGSHKVALDYFMRSAYSNRLKILKDHGFKGQGKLLDFGCGNGIFVKFLCQKGFESYGYDRYSMEHSDTRLLGENYDFITSYDVIEHVEEPREHFREMFNLLKNNGLLILSTNNATEIDLSRTESLELHQPFHRHILSEKALIDLGTSAGLKLIKTYKKYRGNPLNTLFPLVNARFLWSYAYSLGSVVDAWTDSPQWGKVILNPLLIFYAFAGYLFPPPGSIIAVFRR